MMHKTFSCLLFSCLLVGCGSSKKAVETTETIAPKPEWVTSRPIDPNYYIGIGIASKRIHPNDYQTIAKKNALEELSSEIKVQVNANSMLFSIEKNGQFSDEFKSFTQVKSLEQVENFEIVDAYETTDEFWIFYRLSKVQHQKDKQARISKAMEDAKAQLTLAEQSQKENRVKAAFSSYFKALNSVKPYLSESLETTYNDQQVYLGAFIKQRMESMVQTLQLTPAQEKYSVYWGQPLVNNELQFVVKREGLAVSDFPVYFDFHYGRVRPKEGATNEKGIVTTALDKVRETIAIQPVNAKISLVKLYAALIEKPDEITTALLEHFSIPQSQIILNVSAPKVYIETATKTFGKNTGDDVKNAIKQALVNREFSVVTSSRNADFTLTVTSDVKEGGTQFDMYQAHLSGMFTITDQSGTVYYTEEISNITGVQLNYTRAGEKAYSLLAEQVQEVYIPRFKRFLLK